MDKLAELITRHNKGGNPVRNSRSEMNHLPQRQINNPVGDGLSALFKAASQNLQRPFSPEGRQELADSVTSQFANPEAGLDFVAPMGGMVGAIKAFHGSPHKFSKFDMSKLGTGEGAQAYGNGLYFADNIDVAKSYSKINPTTAAPPNRLLNGVELTPGTPEYHAGTLLERSTLKQARKDVASWIQQGSPDALALDGWKKTLATLDGVDSKSAFKVGKNENMYETSLRWPDAAREAVDPMGAQHFLDWDKPMSKQSPAVVKAWKASKNELPANAADDLGGDFSLMYGKDVTPQDFLNTFESLGAKAGGELALKKQGVPGIRYLDGNSRGAGAGSSNYVVFDDAIPEITKRTGN